MIYECNPKTFNNVYIIYLKDKYNMTPRKPLKYEMFIINKDLPHSKGKIYITIDCLAFKNKLIELPYKSILNICSFNEYFG